MNTTQTLPDDLLQARCAFLALFDVADRPKVVSVFLTVARIGCESAADLFFEVHIRLTVEDGSPQALAVWETIEQHGEQALGFCKYVLAYVQLPEAARQAFKQERHRPYIEQWMDNNAATPKQIACLRALGYTGPAPGSRREASLLISSLKAKEGKNG